MNTCILTDRKRSHSSYPDIAAFGDGFLCVWQESDGADDVVRMAKVDPATGIAGATIDLCPAGTVAFTPRISVSGSIATIAWSETASDRWRVCSVTYDGNCVGPRVIHAQGAGSFNPVTVRNVDGKDESNANGIDDSSASWLFWTSIENGKGAVMGLDLRHPENAPVELSAGMCMAGRPEAIIGHDGAVWLVYDGHDGTGYRIFTLRIADGKATAPFVVSVSPNWATRPAAIALPGSVLVAWYESALGNENSYWSAELVFAGGRIVSRRVQRIDMTHNWYCWTSFCRTGAGEKPILLFSRGWRTTGVREYDDGNWSEERVIPSPGGMCLRRARGSTASGKFAIAWQRSEGNGHHDRFSDVGMTLFDAIGELDLAGSSEKGNNFNWPIPVSKELTTLPATSVAEWETRSQAPYRGKKVMWGDIHGQSGLSDGQGEVDEYFAFARDIAKLDFTSLTDHDCFPNILSPAEWEYSRAICNASNRTGDLVTILAFEWTSNEYKTDYGHKNSYFPGNAGSVFRSTEPSGTDPGALFASLRARGAFCVPHHPAAVWTLASAATDWDYHDEKVQRLVEICSRHAPFEVFGNTSVYTKNVNQIEGHSVVDALGRGYRLGIIAGSDSHQLEHGIEGGILAAFADEPTREGVFKALYDRAVYATTGARIRLECSLNGVPMGNALELDAGKSAGFAFRCFGTSIIETVDIITDRGTMKTFRPEAERFDAAHVFAPDDGFAWCYMRVMQYDNHIAWSSPIWVDRKGAK